MVTGIFRTASNGNTNNLLEIGIEQKVRVAREGEKAHEVTGQSKPLRAYIVTWLTTR